MRLRHFVAIAILSASVTVRADTLANVTSGTTTNSVAGYLGQSFTVTGSGSFTNVAFNFYTPSLTSYATGTGYLFSLAYAGTPAALGSSAAGYLGSATAAGGVYNFGSSLTLTAGNVYWFFESALVPASTVTGDTLYAGGVAYSSTSANGSFLLNNSSSTNFNVAGTAVSSVTPEPSSIVLLGTGLLGVAGTLKRRYA